MERERERERGGGVGGGVRVDSVIVCTVPVSNASM